MPAFVRCRWPVRSNKGFGPSDTNILRRLQQELDLHSLKRKHNAAFFRAIENASIKQGGNIAMNSLYVAAYTSCCFSYGDWTRAAQRLE